MADTMDSFLLTHEKYVHPNYALKEDNIYIYGCDSKYVWFAVTPKEVFFLKKRK